MKRICSLFTWNLVSLQACLAIVLFGFFAPLAAQDRTPPSEVAIGVRGGSAWNADYTGGTCIWYLPVVGDLDWRSLFATGPTGVPVVDKEHAYLIWVSDFRVEVLEAPPSLGGSGLLFVALAPAGEATIYFSDTPETRDFSDPLHPSNMGEPVATFVRKASILRSNDSLVSDTFIFSAELVSSHTFKLSGKRFNFADLIPYGMTCFEYGENFSTVEFATCIAIGSAGGTKPGTPAGH
jgi:hypothetical protein